MPYERVLSGPEGMLLYGPEFSDEVFGEYVFGDDVFFLGLQISDTCGFSFATRAPNRQVCSVKKSEKTGQFLLKKTCGIFPVVF